ncbi:VCBS repeat-containing protein [Flagellimonas myxillae]|uniref:VCBS repeat-containing protein n=1 Tax=Flagellimonas myxillae TaxID=2942214 RepID=UPI00201EFB72|nr:VCBS repeat-containing protein [Muricauda myxillae]MCL6265450.1 VCBS repeat-containing protein [Muricauda myxillae]
MRSHHKALLLLFCIVASCNKIDSSKLFSKMPSSHTGIKFKNLVTETDEFNILTYGNIYNGGGVAVGDINNDGLQDIYFTGSMVGSRLYVNKGNFKFEEIAQKAGVFAEGLWNTGTSMADVNGDGLLDIYVCRSAAKAKEKRRNLLFINNGDLTFTEKGAAYGLDDFGYSTQGNFFDYDKDGDLDVFVLNHSVQPYSSLKNASKNLRKKQYPDYADRLYRNDNGKFVDVSAEAGIMSSVLGFGLSVSVSDVNDDNWPDIYISNDFHEHDFLYLNNGDGTFTESLKEFIGHTSHFSMGSDISDINNDGMPDIVTLDMLPEGNFRQKMVSGPDNYDKHQFLVDSDFHHQYMRNMLHLNKGNSFAEIGQLAGIHATDWSWAPLFADFDNDGFKDLFVTNGVKRDYTNMDFMNFAVQKRLEEMDSGVETVIKDLLENIPSTIEENYAYRNKGDLTFGKTTNDWGLGGKSLSNGAAYADLDNDGDYDLIVNNTDQEAFIYRNNSDLRKENNYLKIQLKGKDGNTLAVGAKVILKSDTLLLHQELYPARGFQSSVDPSLIFGLGSHQTVEELKIIWPDGMVSTQNNVAVNQTLQFKQEEATVAQTSEETTESQYFSDVTADSLLVFYHVENRFVDFKRESLIPHQLSTQGPKVAKADVNNDGLEDIYIGGAKGAPGILLLQRRSGDFVETNTSSLGSDTASEDTGALFFDADNDNDMDLYVVSGSHEFEEDAPELQDRLYINNNGNFRKKESALPTMLANGSCVRAYDFDQDGDQDLFVGGRSVPGKYPTASRSYILENDGKGNFSDSTQSVNQDLGEIGMVSDALWTDFNGDSVKDLILVGEFMAVRFFRNDNGKLIEETNAVPAKNSKGWWNKIVEGDFDNDGDLDYVIGNFGWNSQLKASTTEPVQLYAKDFDDNGAIDPILCSYLMGESYPVFSKDDLVEQLNGLKPKYVNYSDYATQKITDIFTPEELEGAYVLEANNFATSYVENLGNGQFTLSPLTTQAQFSPIYAVLAEDIDHDGNLDLVLAGNFYGTRVKYGRYDANKGLLLLGNGQGGFQAVGDMESGLDVDGEVRDLVLINKDSENPLLLFARNNSSVQLYSTKTETTD